jgi:EAL domain-containing protein (putative c-di-GMP-specific phosphodiesterase class I)
MYAAKGAGKGCHRLFHPQMHDVALHRQALLHGLDGAHDRGEIVTYFQPIVDMATGVPKGAEALVRWIHPVHGMLTPDTFVELAEETGRIGPITRHVLELACVEATSWDGRLDAPTGAYVSVNLSARDFRDRRLADSVDQTLSDTGLAPDRLLLEVTEGAINDEGEAVRTLARLRDLGVRIAIDDFGTGHSSLARLRSLPFDVVKIAQPLVSHANRSPRDRDFAQLMVDLARVLDVDAIAEGVESAAQAAVLREIGFVAAQGYFYSPAVPAADLWSSWRLGAGSRRPSARDRRAPGGRRAADISLVPERRAAGAQD